MFTLLVNLEQTTPPSFSKAIDINQQLLRRYRELSSDSPSYQTRLFLSPLAFPANRTESLLPLATSANPDLPRMRANMTTVIKISSFNGGNADMTESVDEYLDDVETAALSWDLMLTPGIIEPTNKSEISLFRQNLERDGDAWHWWYFVLPEADKKDYAKIVAELRERYGVKASQASSLFAVQNEILSLTQGELEHI